MEYKVTIFDIAKKAKVSVGTVSNAINKKDGVSRRTKKKVDSAIQKLGYRPNIIARSLRSRKTHIIGLIFT